MVKTTVYLPEELELRLDAESAATGVSKAELIRKGVALLLDGSDRPKRSQPLPIFRSGRAVIVVADTSALFAAFDADQPEHRNALAVMEREVLAVSPLVVTELDHL